MSASRLLNFSKLSMRKPLCLTKEEVLSDVRKLVFDQLEFEEFFLKGQDYPDLSFQNKDGVTFELLYFLASKRPKLEVFK